MHLQPWPYVRQDIASGCSISTAVNECNRICVNYISQPSCRGGTQHMIRSLNLQCTHCTLSAHIWYQHITKYTQRTALATNTSLTTIMYAPTQVHSAYNHVCTHTQHYVHSVYSYMLPATYITTYTCIAQSETILVIISGSKVSTSITTTSKRNLTRLQKIG